MAKDNGNEQAKNVYVPNKALNAKKPANAAEVQGTANGAAGTKKMNKGARVAIIVIAALLAVLLIFGMVALIYINVINKRIDGRTTQHGVMRGTRAKDLPQYSGNEDSLGILICGFDYDVNLDDGTSYYSDEENKIGNTDVIMYVSYNLKDNKVSVLSVMRDTFVGEEVNTGGEYKINNLFMNAEDENNRMQALADVFSDQFKLPVDYYVTLDMDSMKILVERVGNLHVYVPLDIIDPKTGNSIEEGWRWLTPEHVEFVLRNRYSPTYGGQSDFMRNNVQMNVMSSVFRLFKTMTAQDLVKWGNVLLYHIKTDMDAWDMLGLLQSAMKIEADEIVFVRPPYAGVDYKGKAVLCLLEEETAELLNEHFRPEGVSISAEELNIQCVEYDPGNVYPASIRTLGSVDENTPPQPAN